MKLILLLAFSILTTSMSAQIAEDKYKHYFAGVATSGVAYRYVYEKTKNKNKALIYSIGAAIIVGALKETVDSTQKGNKFDPEDLLATTLGGLTVGITIKLFDNDKNNKKIF